MRIVYVGELDRTPYAPDHLGIRQGLESFDGLVVDPVLNEPSKSVAQILAFKPDLIVHGNTDSLGQGLGGTIRKYTTAKQIFWMLDYQPVMEWYPWDRWQQDLGMYDAILLSNRNQLEAWGKKFIAPAYYMPHGCWVTEPRKNQEFHHKAVFVGSHGQSGWYRARADLLEQIMQKEKFDWMTEDSVEGRNGIWKAMPEIYHTSDAVLDISHEWNADGYASGRFFYSAGLGGCSVTKRFPNCEELYPKSCKAYFDTADEAVELMRFYQSHGREREKMKMNAWEWNKKHHHYEKRFKEMIKLVHAR